MEAATPRITRLVANGPGENSESCLSVTKVLVQLLKFGVSGVIAVSISSFLYYTFKGELPPYLIILPYLIGTINAPEVGYYYVTSAIGGTIHFFMTKIWVIKPEVHYCDGCGRRLG